VLKGFECSQTAHFGFSLLPNSKISQDQATSQRGVGESKKGFGLARNSKEAHQHPQKQQHATEGVVGYKYPTSQKLAVTDPVKTGATEIQTTSH